MFHKKVYFCTENTHQETCVLWKIQTEKREFCGKIQTEDPEFCGKKQKENPEFCGKNRNRILNFVGKEQKQNPEFCGKMQTERREFYGKIHIEFDFCCMYDQIEYDYLSNLLYLHVTMLPQYVRSVCNTIARGAGRRLENELFFMIFRKISQQIWTKRGGRGRGGVVASPLHTPLLYATICKMESQTSIVAQKLIR